MKEYAVNEEKGKQYELKPDPFEQHPHLAELKKKAETVAIDSKEYWKLRCRYLEKTLDSTYSIQERNNCHRLYHVLISRA